MADASFVQTSFLGGEWSRSMQGRMDRPDYRTAMNVCLNGFPMEQGAWCRRPGSRHCGTTRGGAAGRVVSFDFKQSSPYAMEFTAGYLRFFAGPLLVMTNDQQAVTSISSANPAKVLTGTHGWATGNQVKFNTLGANNPLLQNRLFTITVTSATEFTLADAITGTAIDGSTLGTFVSGNVQRVYEIATPYTGSLWSSLRAIQADIPTTNSTTPGAVLLQASIKPYVLQVTGAPTDTTFATFSLAAAVFKDGPYFDPVPGGTLATPSALIGNITLTLSFPAYDATKSYSIGDYAVSSSINYKSLQDGNVGNTPASSPTYWVAVSAADAIGPNGFQGSDVGRHIRFYSEPPLWASGASYTAGSSIVAYAGVYWKALTTHTAATTSTPNTTPTVWALYPTGAIWTWGRVTALSNIIDRALAGSASIGDMTSGGGLAAAFDGSLSQAASASAEKLSGTVSGLIIGPNNVTLSSYVGKNYSGASDQKIAQAVVYPSNDVGLVGGGFTPSGVPFVLSIVLNLRGKASAPSSASDGTLIGTSGSISNTTAPVTIISTDQATSWKYVWVEQITTATIINGDFITAYSIINAIAELSLFNPPGTGTSQGVTVQIVGDPLLYTSAIRTWRLGLYSDTTGWPTCGTYHEGRLWFSGVIGNRIDASKSNDPFNFAPTNPDGSVSANNAISYTFNAPDVNPIFWMVPDYHGIVCGTQAGEWLVQATSQNLPLTPTSIQAHRVTTNQCANIEPRRTDLTLVLVQNFQRTLLEYFADVYSGKFAARDIAESAKHLTATGIEEIACQQELVPIIWARLGDGSLKGLTYRRQTLVSSQPADMMGWHRHTLGSGRTVESIAIAASSDGTLPTLAMVTNDATTGIRHVEMLTNVFMETDDLADAWFLDDAVVPTSTSSDNGTPSPYGGLTLHGLWHLNDKLVSVVVDGLDCGDFTVSSGAVTVPYGDGVSAGTGGGLFTAAYASTAAQIVVGFTYTSDGQIVRPNAPAESGARNGPAFGKERRSQKFAMLFNNTATLAISVGTDFGSVDPVVFCAANDVPLTRLQMFSGVYKNTIEDGYGLDGMLCWRATRPLPATIAAIGAMLHTQDE